MSERQSRRDKSAADQQRIRAACASTARRAQAASVTDRDGIAEVAAEELEVNSLPADRFHVDFVVDAVMTTCERAARKHVLRGFGLMFNSARDIVATFKKGSVPGYLNPPQSSVLPIWAGQDDWLVQPVLDPSADVMLRRIFDDLHPINEGPDEPPNIRAFGCWLMLQPVGSVGGDPGEIVVMAGKVRVGVLAPADAARVRPTLVRVQGRGEVMQVDCSVYGSSYVDMRLELLLPAEFGQ